MVDRRRRLVVLIKILCQVRDINMLWGVFLVHFINHKMYLLFTGSGQVMVLRQALCSAYQKHRLEFTARNEEELNTILKDMRKTDNSESFQYNILRYFGFNLHLF